MVEQIEERPELQVALPLASLGMRLRDQVEQDKAERLDIEQEWLKDLRQKAGKYESKVKFEPNASRAFVRLTRTKIRTINARMGEIVNPALSKAWSVEPSPIPELSPERSQFLRELLEEGFAAEGREASEVDEEAIMKLEMEYAETAAKKMEKQVADAFLNFKMTRIARLVYDSGHTYGTGILKGPLVSTKVIRKWEKVEGGTFGVVEKEVLAPFAEFCRVWDYFPEMAASSLYATTHQTQRHVFNKAQFHALARRKSFRGEVIEKHMANNAEGDFQWANFDLEVFQSARNDPASLSRVGQKYQVYDMWVALDGADLRKEGAAISGK